MSVKEITSLEEVEPWVDQWNHLVNRRPMRTTWWLCNWWKHFGHADPKKQLSIWLVTSDDESATPTLIGIAPLYRVQFGSRQVLRFLGDGQTCTDHTTWFAKPGFEEQVSTAIVSQLSTSNWSRLQLDAVDQVDSSMSCVLELLETRQCTRHNKATDSCWSVELPSTWDEYMAKLSKNHRKRCRRWHRQYFESGKVELVEATEENVDEIWGQFLDLHRQRWGDSKRPDGSFSDRNFANFHRDVSRELLRQGQLRLSCLKLDGQPIAAEYQLVDGDTLYAYQSGVSVEHADIGPGNLSLLATIRYCIENGITHLDFLRGDEDYKQHWKAEKASCHHVSIWPAGIAGKVEYGLQRLRVAAGEWIPR